jgi:hypothetical protein
MRVRTSLLALCSLLLLTGGVQAQQSQQYAYRLKAAFLFNFAKFVDWPATAFTNDNSPFIIGVLGEDPFGDELTQTVAGKKIDDHSIMIQPFHAATDATNCHILFICTSEKKRLAEIVPRLRGNPVLTVGETDGFIESGGVINFFTENNKIRFQISDDAAKAAGLKISSKLLSLSARPAR